MWMGFSTWHLAKFILSGGEPAEGLDANGFVCKYKKWGGLHVGGRPYSFA